MPTERDDVAACSCRAKGYAYEEHTRVPFLISGPNVYPRSRIRTQSTSLDFAATVLGLAGVCRHCPCMGGSARREG